MKKLHKKTKAVAELFFYHTANESCNGKPITNNKCTSDCGGLLNIIYPPIRP